MGDKNVVSALITAILILTIVSAVASADDGCSIESDRKAQSTDDLLSYRINYIIGDKPVFLFFYADWCHFCHQQMPIIGELEEEYAEKLAFIHINVTERPDHAEEFGVRALPTMFIISAYLHSLSPATVTHPWLGEVYQPAWYGDGQNYWACDFIGVFGPLGLYDHATGKTTRLAALRWIQTHTAPGGSDALIEERVRGADLFRDAILYFMLFDPGDAPPLDPRPAQPLTFYAQGIGRIFARTGWDQGATWFDYSMGWNSMDHQQGDGNQFEFYRQGEWLTKERTGYGYLTFRRLPSIFHNFY